VGYTFVGDAATLRAFIAEDEGDGVSDREEFHEFLRGYTRRTRLDLTSS